MLPSEVAPSKNSTVPVVGTVDAVICDDWTVAVNVTD